MAVLSNDDFVEIRDIVYSDPDLRVTFKSWSLSKANWKALFQACEDWMVNGFSSTPTNTAKDALDAVVTTTVAQAKAIWKVWAFWKSTKVW